MVRDKVWQRRFVERTGLLPQPRFAAVEGSRIEAGGPWAAGDLGEVLSRTPGSYILKPRLGSNGFCVVRIVCHPDGSLAVASDCPTPHATWTSSRATRRMRS